MLEQDQAPGGSSDPADTAPAVDDVVVCATCDALVARASDRIERFGSHVHDRVNPSGHAFRIGCFARAAGVRDVGEESGEFPWFPGHRWTIGVCSSCWTQLGWRFDGGSRSVFWGLVLDRLRVRGS